MKISISELLGPLHDIQDKNCLLELLLLSDVCFEAREGRGSTDSIHPSVDTTWWWRRRRGNHSAAAVLSWISCSGASNSEMLIFNASQPLQSLSLAYGHQSLCSIPLKKTLSCELLGGQRISRSVNIRPRELIGQNFSRLWSTL